GPPANVSAVRTEGGILVRWARPDDDGGIALVQYVLDRRTPEGGHITMTFAPNATAFLDEAAGPERAYTYEVRAENALGAGPPLDASVEGEPAGGGLGVPGPGVWALSVAAVVAAVTSSCGARRRARPPS
ncbi:MAG: fibronectin type III domain-containing protein, partial [Methanobacteriota archaeon]